MKEGRTVISDYEAHAVGLNQMDYAQMENTLNWEISLWQRLEVKQGGRQDTQT